MPGVQDFLVECSNLAEHESVLTWEACRCCFSAFVPSNESCIGWGLGTRLQVEGKWMNEWEEYSEE